MNLLKLLPIFVCLFTASSYAANNIEQVKINNIVSKTVRPLMQKYTIPGMAIGVTINGDNYFYNYGIASKKTRHRVTNKTLFEVGSVSKTLTATLASYAQVNGNLSLSDSVSKYLPELRGTSFDHINLINLGTYTAGGLPLQFPEDVSNERLMDYYKHWQSNHAPGTYRRYSNPSLGLLGLLAAKSMNMSFDNGMEEKLFPALGMKHSYINVPATQMKNYAQGYTKEDIPVRVNPGVLASETYGVKTNTTDLIRFIEANMNVIDLDEKWQRAIIGTHTGYFTVGGITQDLAWEQYAYPVELKQLLAGNSNAMASQSNAATKLDPPLQPQINVFINKTGSTSAQSWTLPCLVTFIPTQKIGIVILANKHYPIDQRVMAAYQILAELNDL